MIASLALPPATELTEGRQHQNLSRNEAMVGSSKSSLLHPSPETVTDGQLQMSCRAAQLTAAQWTQQNMQNIITISNIYLTIDTPNLL